MHVHSLIAPFLSASRGKPPPTFHSCQTFIGMLMPAALDCSTISSHVLSVARVEIVMDCGNSWAKSSIARSVGRAVPS